METSTVSDSEDPGLGRSAFDNQLTFKKIMDFVGTDHQSLLACRLVSHSWNEMALTTLQSLGTAVALEQTDATRVGDDLSGPLIQKQAEAYAQQQCDQFNELNSALAQIDMKLELNGNQSKPEVADIFKAIHAISVAGQWTITSITYNVCPSHDADSDISFQKFVKNCASTITHLTYANLSMLDQDHDHDHEANEVQTTPVSEHEEEADNFIVEFGPLEFPNLMDICIQFLPFTRMGAGRTFRSAVAESWTTPILVANSAPKLRVLRVMHDYGYGWTPYERELGLESRQFHFNNLLSPTISARIRELDLPISKWEEWADKNNGDDLHFPSVENLKLHLHDKAVKTLLENGTPVIKFLRKSFPSLQKLVLDWVGTADLDNGNENTNENLRNFYHFFALQLPNVLHFGLTSSLRLSRASCVNLGRLLLSMANQTPAVKIVNLDFNTFCQLNALSFDFSHELPVAEPLYTGIKFPNVTTFHLTGLTPPSVWFHRLEDEEIAQVPAMLDAVFPNLETISVDLGPLLRETGDDHQLNIFEDCVLPGVLKKTRKIRRLEIETYVRNWFAKPELDLENSILAQGLEHLELRLSRNCWCDQEPELIKVPELETVLTRFPSLKIFAIDPKLVRSSNGEGEFDKIVTELRVLRTKFPGIDIRVY